MFFLLLSAAVITFIAATLWRVEQNEKRVVELYPPQGDFVDVDGHPVHYIEMGEGPALVMIHGASGNARDFTFGLAQKLATSYRVIIFDRPGLGHTPQLAPFDVSITDQANLLASAAIALGAERPIVAGQSFGGSVTMAWAVARPDNIAAAVSISGATHTWEGGLDPLTAGLANPIIGPVLSRVASAWVSRDYVADRVRAAFTPQEALDGYAEHIGTPLILRPASLMANARQRDTLKADIRAIVPDYRTLALPLEILHGDADTTVSFELHAARLAEDVQNANLVRLKGLGHMPQHLAHDEVINAIDRAATRAGLR